MKLIVVTPVGPGHEVYVEQAERSVYEARIFEQGPFDSIKHVVVDDSKGSLGRSLARNNGVLSEDSDWVFFLDADDLLNKDAFLLFKRAPDVTAIFGSVSTRRLSPGRKLHPPSTTIGVIPNNVFPLSWNTLMLHGPKGTLSQGAFFKRGPLLEYPYLERLDSGEDFEFYLSLLSKYDFVKIDSPLVTVCRDTPSAGGPRGYTNLDWYAACEPFVEFWRRRGRVPIAPETRKADYWLP